MTFPRGLTADEQQAWARLASSVDPIAGRKRPIVAPAGSPMVPAPHAKNASVTRTKPIRPASQPPRPSAQQPVPQPVPRVARRIGQSSLDSTWDRKLKSGSITPDYTLDLHDYYVDAAHARLDSGMMQARAMEARLVLVITGRPRPVEAADRGEKRGVIRAKLLDWLAAGDHADAIAAVRKAHRKHGGEGALYIVLRRNR